MKRSELQTEISDYSLDMTRLIVLQQENLPGPWHVEVNIILEIVFKINIVLFVSNLNFDHYKLNFLDFYDNELTHKKIIYRRLFFGIDSYSAS